MYCTLSLESAAQQVNKNTEHKWSMYPQTILNSYSFLKKKITIKKNGHIYLLFYLFSTKNMLTTTKEVRS